MLLAKQPKSSRHLSEGCIRRTHLETWGTGLSLFSSLSSRALNTNFTIISIRYHQICFFHINSTFKSQNYSMKKVWHPLSICFMNFFSFTDGTAFRTFWKMKILNVACRCRQRKGEIIWSVMGETEVRTAGPGGPAGPVSPSLPGRPWVKEGTEGGRRRAK